MIVYLLFIFFLTFLNYYNRPDLYLTKDYKEGIHNNNHRVAIGGFVFLVLLFGLRHPSMGNDLRYLSSFGYLGSFDIINSYSWGYVIQINNYLNYEKGYIILNKLIGSIFNNRQFFILSIAFLSLFPIYRFINTRSESPFISYIIFMGLPVFLMYFSGLRQVLAIGICVFSLDFLENKKIVWFVLLVLFASFFHYSAWVFLLAYPVYYLKISKNVRWGTLIALGLFYIFRRRLFSIFAQFLKQDATIVDTGALTLFVVFSAVYTFCFFFIDKHTITDSRINGYLNLFYIACVMQSFAGLHNLVMRIGYYFMIALVVLLPSILNSLVSSKDRALATTIVVFCFGLFGLYSLRSSSWAQAVPYYFFWQYVFL